MSQSIFATLTPENSVAQKCLASLVEKHGGPLTLTTPSLAALPNVRINPAGSADETDERCRQSEYQLVLALDQPGSGSWLVGKLGAGAVEIDLPLCSSRSHQLQGRHICKIWIHPRSGVLMLQNTSQFHSILYLHGNGISDTKLQYLDQHVLHMKTNHLRIGPLDLVLEFVVDDFMAYIASRNAYMLQSSSRHWQYADVDLEGRLEDLQQEKQHYTHLDALPTAEQLHIRDVILHHTVSRGAFGIVMVGVDRWSGDMVACKTIHSRQHEAQLVRNEIRIAATIPKDTTGLVSLLSSWCEHGQSPPCFLSKFETVYMVMPYAPWSFDTVAWSTVLSATRIALFRQVLEGLRDLHAAGIMHRDISIRNLLVFSLTPPHAAICDYGKSKIGSRGSLVGLGPPGFTAPEVGQSAGYTNAIDIFSLGLSFLATYGRWPGYGESVAGHDNYQRLLQHLADLSVDLPHGLGILLRSMLLWDPADRPTAQEILAHEIWLQVAEDESRDMGVSSDTTKSSGGDSGDGSGTSTVAMVSRHRRSHGISPSGSRQTQNKRRLRIASRERASVSRIKTKETRGPSGSDSLLSPPPVLYAS